MRKYIILALTLLVSLNLSAQVDRSKAPAAGPTPIIKMGDNKEFKLSNGLRVIVVEDHKLPTISMNISFINDPILEGDRTGFSSLYGDLWKKGTTSKDMDSINEELDFIGASLWTSNGSIGFGSLSKYTNQMLELLTDILYNPTFPASEEEKLKTQYESGLSTVKTDPSSIMSNIRSATIYGKNHPYGDIATAEKLDNFSAADCKLFYDTYIKPNNAIMVIVGDITFKDAKKLVNKYFKKWKKGEVPSHKYDFPASPKGVNVIFSNKDAAPQSSISLSYPVDLKIDSEDLMAVTIANFIYGGGGFSAKLMKNLREDKGYTYGAYSRLSSDKLVANMNASGEVNANATDSSFVEMAKEMNNMINGDFTDEDLEMAKATIAGSFSRRLESSSTIASYAFNIAYYNLAEDYYKTYLQRLDAVTREDIIRVSKKYFHPDNAYYFVVGDRALIPALEKLDSDGVVVELDYKGDVVVKEEIAADVTVESVINSYLSFLGGKDLVKSVKDISYKALMSLQGMNIETIYKMVMDDKGEPSFSLVTQMEGNVMMEIRYIDGVATIKSPQGEQTLPKEQSGMFKSQAYPFIEAYLDVLGITSALEGTEDIDGKKAYKVKLDRPDGSAYYYYDAKSGELLKSVSTQQGQTQEQTYSEYTKLENGLMFPSILRTSMMGMNVEVKNTEVKINSGLTKTDL